MTYKPATENTTGPGNSTLVALGSAGVFTGVGEQNSLPDVIVSCTTDQAGTLFFEFSNDDVTWSTFPVAGFEVAPGIHEFHTAVKAGRYFRVRYVNGATAQGSLAIYTYFGHFAKPPNAPLNQTIGADADAALTKAVLIGQDDDGVYNSVQTTEDGAIRTSVDSAIINFTYDAYQKVDVDSVTDRFDYYVGGLAGTITATVTIVYADSSKTDAVSAERANL